ncbi:Hypothetical predicted protein, partial [Cloeon dipterum]
MPKFAEAIPNVTVTVGREATLTCVVDDLGSYKVAWLRVDTQTILTIHTHVITKNHRIGVTQSDHRSWYLTIREVRESDRGWYMCQINTDPMKSHVGYLEVVAALGSVLGQKVPSCAQAEGSCYVCDEDFTCAFTSDRNMTNMIQCKKNGDQYTGISEDLTLEKLAALCLNESAQAKPCQSKKLQSMLEDALHNCPNNSVEVNNKLTRILELASLLYGNGSTNNSTSTEASSCQFAETFIWSLATLNGLQLVALCCMVAVKTAKVFAGRHRKSESSIDSLQYDDCGPPVADLVAVQTAPLASLQVHQQPQLQDYADAEYDYVYDHVLQAERRAEKQPSAENTSADNVSVEDDPSNPFYLELYNKVQLRANRR